MFTAIGLGEVLWDICDDGKALGGAPCNFAYHVNALGHVGLPLSRVGEDRLGDEVFKRLEDLGLRTDYIQRDLANPTGQVLVKLDAAGVPDFTIVKNVAWDYMEAEEKWLEAARGADAVCFGTLAQRSRESRRTIQQVLDTASDAVIVYDVNFRQNFYSREVATESLALTTVLKLNEAEVRQMQELLGGGGAEEEFLRGLMREYGIALTCVTRGERGCTLYAHDETVTRPAPPTQVADTVGSGDAFTAGLVIKFLEGRPLSAISEGANLLGSFVASRRGATPALPPELVARFNAL